jgi:hypothetical protein
MHILLDIIFDNAYRCSVAEIEETSFGSSVTPDSDPGSRPAFCAGLDSCFSRNDGRS